MRRRLILPILITLIAAPFTFGQRISFEGLVHNRHQPRMYINNIFLPHMDSAKTDLIVGFKIEYDDLTFLKQNPLTNTGIEHNKTFQANVQANIEVYKINPDAMDAFHKWQKEARPMADERRSGDHDRDRYRRPPNRENVDELGRKIANNSTIIARGNWKGGVTAETYQETQSDKLYLQGYVTIPLEPGTYLYQLQLSQPDISNQDSRSFWRHVRVPNLEKDSTSNLIFLESTKNVTIPGSYPLINMSNDAFFGKDFTLLCMIPGYNAQHSYTVDIKKLGDNPGDTTATEPVFQKIIPSDQIHTGVKVIPSTDTTQVYLNLSKSSIPYTYASLRIPNSTFANAMFRIMVKDSTENRTIGRMVYQSRWVDMPTSLYNLDIAIDMLKFILPKNDIKKQFSGNDSQREAKFMAFWKKRDPTPHTAYNQLMAEYYRRIDYAYTHFSSMQVPGYDSDQGKIYIKYGPPDSVQREFPTNGPSIVIWNYGSHKFVFQATTGFGDYKLISQE
ncbi:MAG TPA: GWxTD domain-containing protein [Balneolales bacterium]|nr:GWxTD domain-containing protein [Balneolales bacterium]